MGLEQNQWAYMHNSADVVDRLLFFGKLGLPQVFSIF